MSGGGRKICWPEQIKRETLEETPKKRQAKEKRQATSSSDTSGDPCHRDSEVRSSAVAVAGAEVMAAGDGDPTAVFSCSELHRGPPSRAHGGPDDGCPSTLPPYPKVGGNEHQKTRPRSIFWVLWVRCRKPLGGGILFGQTKPPFFGFPKTSKSFLSAPCNVKYQKFFLPSKIP